MPRYGGSPARSEKSGFAGFWRSRRKEKASREFDRRYASAPSDSSAGPRAALYKGQMGSTHKKSSRMQGQGQSANGRVREFAVKRQRFSRSALVYGLIAAVACFALAFVVVYPAARDYYVMMRTTAQQQAEYEALTERQDYIQAEIDRLSTDEGIEDEASKEFGWVKEGDNAVYVNGLDPSDEDPVYADVLAGSVPAPATWYSGLLDPLFGVDPNNVGSSK